MELSTVKDAFDKVIKKQKLSSAKAGELIDHIVQDFEDALKKLLAPAAATADDGGSDGACSAQKTVLVDLGSKLNGLSPANQLEASQKDLATVLGKFTKVLDKQFTADMSKAHRGNVERDAVVLNRIIAGHFYRNGMFDVGDSFVKESGATSASDEELRTEFSRLYSILAAMRSRDLGPALDWAVSKRELLLQKGSDLELRLHRTQFAEILISGSRDDALAYAKAHLAPLASTYKAEVQKLMAAMLWIGRLEGSPYSSLAGAGRWEDLAAELTRQFCVTLGQSAGADPLGLVVRAGAESLPVMLKMASVMAATNQDWQGMKQLPMPLDLGVEFQFHSIFVCPVLWEQATEENPPTMLPCGHVLCKQAVVKLSKSSARPFKCPYCPYDATIAECRQLFL